MQAAKGRRLGWLGVLVPLCGLLSGCGLFKPHTDQELLAHNPAVGGPGRFAAQYAVHFPDMLDVYIEGRPEWSGRRPVGVDGRITLGPDVRLRVEGHTTPEIVELLAQETGAAAERVRVSVAEYKSQHLYLHGEVKGEPRAVPYLGPETVLELLQRAGGITPGAAPGDIQVVRPHVADGKQPEVFEVDLSAILQKKSDETNVKLRPLDHVYIGQTRTCSIRKCLPPWLRPLFTWLCGMSRPGQPSDLPPHERPFPGLAQRRAARYSRSPEVR
jgi:protein involved in polysaccharide export with SLBB domain